MTIAARIRRAILGFGDADNVHLVDYKITMRYGQNLSDVLRNIELAYKVLGKK